MRWASDGMTVYLRRHPEHADHRQEAEFVKYRVLVAAGDMARIEYAGEPDGVDRTDRWVDVADLVSEQQVAELAAARLVAPARATVGDLQIPWDGTVPKL